MDGTNIPLEKKKTLTPLDIRVKNHLRIGLKVSFHN